jgi:hypothetical protein
VKGGIEVEQAEPVEKEVSEVTLRLLIPKGEEIPEGEIPDTV